MTGNLMKDKLERILVVYFEVLSGHFSGATKRNHENPQSG
jgi:hypothetical protein